MQNTILNTSELFDIEPLIAPGIDWVLWLEVTLSIVAGLLLLLIMLYLLRFLYRPLLFKWQLFRLVKRVPKNQASFSKVELFTIYDWLQRYRAWLKLTGQNIDNPQLGVLVGQVNFACFSQQIVSRETYLDLIAQAQKIVKSSTFSTHEFSLLKKLKLRVVKWK